ncbi:50S ribosomal protein L9 [Pseudonocardia eucalypti]|uniref:Large ribosomal subunit protein bL9 n=1 Tax=Pseudonocardia eucalypti TaxID=648755 RepID=A0ABP9PDI6_9PSEU|nr:large subunit ribosomal protein L9 [Pseudonocardia eucalypti]
MKLILTADVANLGAPGDIVEVKDGYGRNYLLPRQLAIPATRGAEKQVAQIRKGREVRAVRDLDHAKELAGTLKGLPPVRLAVRAAKDSGRLFGSVTPAEVVAAVSKVGGPKLDRRTVSLPASIKSTGRHTVSVKLHPEVVVQFPIEVSAS